MESKSTVIITGSSSGIGLQAAKVLAQTGQWFVMMACRDLAKAQQAAQTVGIPQDSYAILQLDLATLAGVRQFVQDFRKSGRTLDALVCNAAIYTPTAQEPRRTVDGFELSVGTNHLGHFLLSQLLLADLQQAAAPRLVFIGTVTHNPKELGGSIPPRPHLGDLSGLEAGFKAPHTMIDGKAYNPVKAYKDSKVCNLLTMREFHRRYHASHGITFNALYPGCVATSGLFRESPRLFRQLFPVFQRYITKGFVSEAAAGQRVAAVVADAAYNQSGVYWSWGNRQKKDGKSFIKEVSSEASDDDKAKRLWELSAGLVGLS
ncbi:protochlorophyllide reductase [Candidatus Cyanaurora vandensis]|uniref:protochlorophyllide reductase n=1 Tax=Candidatus Cyanaurora vandensis TaxID=2714958 RepID=UPI00257E5DA7|nr:protochlorophyllide reductase [Candidatus Cyanaurora vandensis]